MHSSRMDYQARLPDRKARPARSSRRAARDPHRRRLDHIADLTLLGLLFVAPLILGGRHPLGRMVFVALAVVLAAAMTAARWTRPDPSRRRSPAEWLLAAAVLLLLLQLLPLPAAVLAWFSPHQAELLPLWNSQSKSPFRLGRWSQVSLAPQATRHALVMLLGYGMVYLGTLARVRRLEDIERVVRWVGIAACTMAGLGLIQYLGSNGRFLWFYEHPFRDTYHCVKGTFINRNHFAHFLALGLGPLIYSIAVAWRSGQNQRAQGFTHGSADRHHLVNGLLLLSLSVVLLSGLLSLSRGGAIASLVALGTCSLFFVRSRLEPIQQPEDPLTLPSPPKRGRGDSNRHLVGRSYLAGLAVVATLLVLSLTITGYDRLAGRLDDLTSGSLEELDPHGGRRTLWAANLRAAHDHLPLGTGVGSHREVCPVYLPRSFAVEFTHADCGYVQIASETGISGLALLATAIFLAARLLAGIWKAARSERQLALAGALAAALAASVVHAVVDFVWYIPACMTITLILAACAERIHRLVAESPVVPAEFVPATAVPATAVPAAAAPAAFGPAAFGSAAFGPVAVAAVSVWMVCELIGPARASIPWDRYLKSSVQASTVRREKLRSFDTQLDDTTRSALESLTLSMIGDLKQVVDADPSDSRGHVRLAGAYLQRFEQLQSDAANQMDLSQIRDAAIASRFASKGELDAWLARAVGPHRMLLEHALHHARRGLALSPLHGEAYLYLAELCFLNGYGPRAKSAYLAQALRVRPHDGGVLFEAGREALLLGDIPRAVGYWREAFHQGGMPQLKLVNLLAGRVPIEFVLESFQPDTSGLRLLHARYRVLQSPDELRQVTRQLAGAVRDDALSADKLPSADRPAHTLWLEAHQLYRKLGDRESADDAIRQAMRLAEDDYTVRVTFASWLTEIQDYAAARRQMEWCLRRHPEDHETRRKLRDVVLADSRARVPTTATNNFSKDSPRRIGGQGEGQHR